MNNVCIREIEVYKQREGKGLKGWEGDRQRQPKAQNFSSKVKKVIGKIRKRG